MVRAFIMVDAAVGHAEELTDDIRELARVTEAHVIAGDYDVIVEAEGDEVYDVIHDVATSVRNMENVLDTKTYICLE